MPRREITDGIERDRAAGKRIRKFYRPGVLLDSGTSIERMGAGIRITPDELNETIILDRRVAILAGDMAEGVRAYSVITSPEVVQGITSLFEAVWRAATELAFYDARFEEIRMPTDPGTARIRLQRRNRR
jgi:hypothetical protein